MHKKFKKIIAMLLMYAFAVNSVIPPASAHIENVVTGISGNNWRGTNGHNSTNLGFYINDSAQVGVLTMDAYMRAMWHYLDGGWNSITNRVNIARIMNVANNPASIIPTDVAVIGDVYGLEMGGKIMHLDTTNGRLTDFIDGNNNYATNVHSNWSRVYLFMNRSDAYWDKPNQFTNVKPTAAQKKNRVISTFRHEIGHVLKLKHPTGYSSSTTASGHTVEFATVTSLRAYYPYSVMNISSFPDEGKHVTLGLMSHDIQNLIARWG